MKSIDEYYETKINEAANIEFDEMTPEDQKTAEKLVKIFKMKSSDIEDVFDGIHGRIIMIPNKQPNKSTYRFSNDEISALAKIKPFRWVETSGDGYISIAF